MMMNSTVCVIIAAKNAGATVARAVRSALAEAETREVVVVDDGSVDGTGAEAFSADDNSGRLKIIRFDHNRGPAAARNCAIEASTAPLLSILDADDFFLPGRFTQMMAEDHWDFIADNIVFVKEECVSQVSTEVKRFRRQARLLVLEDFIAGIFPREARNAGKSASSSQSCGATFWIAMACDITKGFASAKIMIFMHVRLSLVPATRSFIVAVMVLLSVLIRSAASIEPKI